ncbi:hypothetical protein T440DRAFT_404634 [Plenodomus tracheiphilus IPT5]|uniref:Uncharacterized protein n=1 Tax=Plenodomus tracheiphilus IPT5 TaxID=1408161 RepID=A0A6A7AXN7_9PLEO|nr:hypothetical protein T440DRAFT_404634 [Plenodomus tracheiphilus IPT5]
MCLYERIGYEFQSHDYPQATGSFVGGGQNGGGMSTLQSLGLMSSQGSNGPLSSGTDGNGPRENVGAFSQQLPPMP